MARIETFTPFQLDRIKTLVRVKNNSTLVPKQELTSVEVKGFQKVLFSLHEDLRAEGLGDVAHKIIFPNPNK